jgi:hypothetical protein
MKKAVPVTQNALYSCFTLFVADLYSVDAFCCIQEVMFDLSETRSLQNNETPRQKKCT